MARRPRHPSKDIEESVQHAEAHDWVWIKTKGHAWGKLLCPFHDRDGCQIFIWSTPRNPDSHARSIKRDVDRCPHVEAEESEESEECNE